jgi:hypothetical protein
MNQVEKYFIHEEVREGKFPVHAMKVYMRSRCIAPLILNLGTGWR